MIQFRNSFLPGASVSCSASIAPVFVTSRVGTSREELALMRRIDELHLRWPFYGSRKLRAALRAEGVEVNRKQMQRLTTLIRLVSVAPKPRTSTPALEHPVYPYLLRNLVISRPNQVWAADITYIPMPS